MWKITKEERLNGPIGYLHLTRLDDDNEELSEKLMLPVMLNPGCHWDETPGTMTDDQVAELLHGIIDTLQLWEDEITDMVYVKTPVVPAAS